MPKGKTFITNELTVDGLTDSGLYQPNGKYFVKASSERSDKHKAYNAFDINTNTYWECDNVDNPEYNVLSTPYQNTNKALIIKVILQHIVVVAIKLIALGN